jgi:predicted RNase H-like HicB family nuclease
MKANGRYSVTYTLDEESKIWVAEVRGLARCITHGGTIEQTRERIEEAIEVFLDLEKVVRGGKR